MRIDTEIEAVRCRLRGVNAQWYIFELRAIVPHSDARSVNIHSYWFKIGEVPYVVR